jgi:hypothetical protein
MQIKLFRTKVWPVLDVALLKRSCILIGMVFSSYLAAFTKRYVRIFIMASILLAIKPAQTYFRGNKG